MYEMDTPIKEVNTKKEPQIESELKMLENRIQVLNENLDNLFSRLKPIIKEKLLNLLDEEKESENLCGLANAIRINSQEIERMSCFIKDTMSNLEL
jgi:bisphosphoglycerate-dependent phosphoglycerate mutase